MLGSVHLRWISPSITAPKTVADSNFDRQDMLQPCCVGAISRTFEVDYFNVRRAGLFVGAMIECRLGNIEDGITQVWLPVIAAPKTEHNGDVMVSLGTARQFTPVPTDGSLTEEGDAIEGTEEVAA